MAASFGGLPETFGRLKSTFRRLAASWGVDGKLPRVSGSLQWLNTAKSMTYGDGGGGVAGVVGGCLKYSFIGVM